MGNSSEYKCPACMGKMVYDSASGNMKCPYCDTEIEVEKYSEMVSKNTSNNTQKNSPAGQRDGKNLYVCESCGGEIVTDLNTGADKCPYCDNVLVLKGQFEGEFAPDYIIPFEVSKKQAKKIYTEFLEDKKLLPRDFHNKNHVDEIIGVYVPFWLYDTKNSGSVTIKKEILRKKYTDKNGNTRKVYDQYIVSRSGTVEFEKVPEDASEKQDDTLMEAIEPYDFSKLQDFNDLYLSGFLAERYDVSPKSRLKRVYERTSTALTRKLVPKNYGDVTYTLENKNMNLDKVTHKYGLLPVWILNTTWNNEKYTFAINGQTGKMIGDLPIDLRFTAINFLKNAGIFSIAAYIISCIANFM